MSAAGLDIERACHRRYPAWTLYARAFSGSRLEAENIVRRAVARTSHASEAPSSEADAHRRVLRSIRSSALASIRTDTHSAPSVLDMLDTLDTLDRDPRSASTLMLDKLRDLTRWQRRAIELVFLRRPPLPLDEAARKLRTSRAGIVGALKRALNALAFAVRRHAEPSTNAHEHPSLEDLITYVSGALSGDEARAVAAHGRSCTPCGDRLGIMILLKASAVESARLPLLSPSHRRAGLSLFAATSLIAMLAVADAFWPNPWAEHATRENVPGWFHDFFYGERRDAQGAKSDAARGLALLVQGELEQAIDTLEPLVEDSESAPEARAYLGIARYLTGDTSRSTVRLLEDGIDGRRAGRVSRWYLASVLLTRRDIDGARVHLKALTSTRDWFGRAAKALLEKLDEASRSRTTA